MERFDISEGDRLAEMVAAAERGEAVEIVRDGRSVARIVSPREELIDSLRSLHDQLPPAVRTINWSEAVREMREDR